MATKTKFQNTLGDALLGYWTNYVGWGRATRSEYWWTVLFYNFIVGALMPLALAPLWVLATIVPGFTVGVRRLHDTGRSAWNVCWLFLPIVGLIILIVYFCQPGEKKANKWGAPRI